MADTMDLMPPPNEVVRRGNAVYFFGECSAENMFKIKEYLLDIYVDRRNQFAALIINSPGGCADTIAFYDWLKAYPLTLATFVEGLCCSAATALYLAGSIRWMSPSSVFLIHSSSSEYVGTLKEGSASDEHSTLQLFNNTMRKIYLDETKLDKAQLTELLSYKEKFLSAKECVKYGIANKMGIFMENFS